MLKAYKYRLKPNKVQEIQINKTFGCCRFIYNYMLSKKIETYKNDKTSISYVKTAKMLTEMKRQEGFEFLKEVSAAPLQQSLRNLDSAYTNFFKKSMRFPKFKSKGKNRNSYKEILNVDIDFNKFKVRLPKLGWVKISKNRMFNGKLKSVTVSKSKSDKYYVSCLVEEEITKTLPDTTKTVGIDLGIKDFAITSDGVLYPNPKYLKESEVRLKYLQRKFSRQVKGSKRRERTRVLIAKIYESIANQRINNYHHISNEILRENQAIKIEDLNVSGMMKNHKLSGAIADAGWSTFINILTYKANWYGRTVERIPRFYPSSKTCSGCGYVNKELKLRHRTYACPVCGLVIDRDVNAAININKYTPAVSGGEHVEAADYCTVEA